MEDDNGKNDDLELTISYRRLMAGSYEVSINGQLWGEVEQDSTLGHAMWADGDWWLRFAGDYVQPGYGLLTADTLSSLKKVVVEHLRSKLPAVHQWLFRRVLGAYLGDPTGYETLSATLPLDQVLVAGCGGCRAYQEPEPNDPVLWIWAHRYAQSPDCGWIGVCQTCGQDGWVPDRKYQCLH